MGGAVVSRFAIVASGLLYPAYSSYKAVKGANARQYVRWIMYWVVFALFTAVETFTDVFLSWMPFYYELKIIIVFWLVLPYTKGSSYLYRKFIHPNLSKREQEIDLFLENAKERGYQTMVTVGSRGINLAANAVVSAAVKGQAVVTDRLKSYSVMDLSNLPDNTAIHSQGPAAIANPAVVRERHLRSSNPMVSLDNRTEPTDGPSHLTMQYKAFSMMNLTQDFAQDDIGNDSSSGEDYFSTEPPTYTIDDMQITRRSNFAEEAVPQPDDFTTRFYTMPKPKKGKKAKTKQLPPLPKENVNPNVRRSKRKSKPNNHSSYQDLAE
ncbi:unnamed protein product [Clavelina lepadiformis]|uniref:Receptor expression-enhancing protein n=1 Tax=Clavelina lepadiformis TaxID=159417 RepID=A0ABP0H3V7_CLALP